MSILWLIPAAVLLAIPLGRLIKKQAYREVMAYEAQFGDEETEEGASIEVFDILTKVYTTLKRSRASCRPWIHDCIVEMKEGRGCDPRDALAALIMTGDDLAGTRWDTDGMAETFGQAAEKLAALI